MTLIKDRFIPREEISNLLWGMDNEISTHSLSMWLKSKTDDEWVVVPKTYCNLLLQFIEAFNKHNLLIIEKETLKNFEALKKYL